MISFSTRNKRLYNLRQSLKNDNYIRLHCGFCMFCMTCGDSAMVFKMSIPILRRFSTDSSWRNWRRIADFSQPTRLATYHDIPTKSSAPGLAPHLEKYQGSPLDSWIMTTSRDSVAESESWYGACIISTHATSRYVHTHTKRSKFGWLHKLREEKKGRVQNVYKRTWHMISSIESLRDWGKVTLQHSYSTSSGVEVQSYLSKISLTNSFPSAIEILLTALFMRFIASCPSFLHSLSLSARTGFVKSIELLARPSSESMLLSSTASRLMKPQIHTYMYIHFF